MTITVRIPAQLRDTAGGVRDLTVTAPTVAVALNVLEDQYPILYRNICDETGLVRRHINVFINKSLVRGPEGLSTQLMPGDVVTIMTAVSGG